jgi:hypothetical protein
MQKFAALPAELPYGREVARAESLVAAESAGA